MKRIFALVSSILLLATTLMGCSAKQKLTGTWQATADLSGIMQQVLKEKLPDSVLEVTSFPVIVELSFSKDNTCTFTLQKASVEKALEQLLADLEKSLMESLAGSLSQLVSEITLEDIFKHTGINAEALLAGMRSTILDSDIADLLIRRMTFHGYFEITDEKLFISDTEEIDEKTCFAYHYQMEEGPLSLPMVTGETPMEPELTAILSSLSFQKV